MTQPEWQVFQLQWFCAVRQKPLFLIPAEQLIQAGGLKLVWPVSVDVQYPVWVKYVVGFWTVFDNSFEVMNGFQVSFDFVRVLEVSKA